ncbi:hypothetical protein VOLCADRAFT_89050 [Volvox carteri f. nagariensis]|uniref:O-methyltransferase C-terminal domain-containing protein n=1 Tax=Volvox carteri f. nagariensis TaxID=3068 RepID=D8TQN5_VOLCA|nr:uncharacterized protein VOLCADRAFT_89050 [Volvox carteri f. nagariensis]EFJ50065.1 hypothetical protein VOLCADRAFT_89050 [Volvox carteri f. nagariensis]|eukprot:XP_002948685.1 hypothetical protein VOLCADRAFT_89050 [Volvox carteri f. nagariensis]
MNIRISSASNPTFPSTAITLSHHLNSSPQLLGLLRAPSWKPPKAHPYSRLCAAYGLLVEVRQPLSGGGADGTAADAAASLRSADGGSSGTREACTAFYLTDTGVMLQESHPAQMKWLALMLGLPGHYVSRGYLYDNVKQGRMGFEAAFGSDWYSYVAQHPLESTAFDKAMTATSAAAAQSVALGYDFSRHGTVMDVGGGQGMLMTAILHHHPGVRAGYVLELPDVVARARSMGQRGLERLQYIEGDFFQPFPIAANCLVMRLVLHDWPDEEAAAVLRHARAALVRGVPGCRLVVVEAVLPELVGPGEVDAATLQQLEFDMGMMLMTTGRERTLGEWKALFASAGFRLDQLLKPEGSKLPIMVLEVLEVLESGPQDPKQQ